MCAHYHVLLTDYGNYCRLAWEGAELFHKRLKKMVDTERGNFPDTPCSDCGETGTAFRHWGTLVPEGTTGNFCMFCWDQRHEAEKRGEPPKPLGVKPPGVPKEFDDRAIKVTTQSGSIYEFSKPNEKKERTVSCAAKNMGFSTCRILCLIIGESLWIKPLNGKDPGLHLWTTSSVVSIE